MLAPLVAAILPLLLWPIEVFFPYPHIIEEGAKFLLVLYIINSKERDSKFFLAISSGIMFALSESVLYLFNITALGDISTLILRLAITTPLHILTTLAILIPSLLNKKLLILGLILAICIHYIHNQYIDTLY